MYVNREHIPVLLGNRRIEFCPLKIMYTLSLVKGCAPIFIYRKALGLSKIDLYLIGNIILIVANAKFSPHHSYYQDTSVRKSLYNYTMSMTIRDRKLKLKNVNL